MSKVTVQVLQTLFDISIQETGSVFNAFDIAEANGISLADDLTVGQVLDIPDTIARASKEVQYLQARNVKPATGMQLLDELEYEFPTQY